VCRLRLIEGQRLDTAFKLRPARFERTCVDSVQASGGWFRLLCYLPVCCPLSVTSPFALNIKAPPVVLISSDTLRADRLGCYGYAALSSQHIDSPEAGVDPQLRIDAFEDYGRRYSLPPLVA
jgi:hypothetical protein